MFKRFLAMIISVCAVLSYMIIPASAEFCWEENFEDGLPDFAYSVDPSGGTYNCNADTGALLLDDYNGTTSLNRGVEWTGTYDVERDLIIQHDMKWDNWKDLNYNTRLLLYMYAGGGRRILHSIDPTRYWFNNGSDTPKVADTAMQDKEWYRFTYHFKENRTKVDVYRQKVGSEEAPVAILKDFSTQQTDNSQKINFMQGPSTSAYYDNIRVINGTFLKDGGFFMNGEEILDISCIDDGTLSVKADVATSNVVTETQGSAKVIKAKSVETLLMAFDSNGSIVDCIFGGKNEIMAGINTIQAEFATDTFVDNVQDGELKFCIWEDLLTARPVMAPVVLGK